MIYSQSLPITIERDTSFINTNTNYNHGHLDQTKFNSKNTFLPAATAVTKAKPKRKSITKVIKNNM